MSNFFNATKLHMLGHNSTTNSITFDQKPEFSLLSCQYTCVTFYFLHTEQRKVYL